jgi:hypothetical protein
MKIQTAKIIWQVILSTFLKTTFLKSKIPDLDLITLSNHQQIHPVAERKTIRKL